MNRDRLSTTDDCAKIETMDFQQRLDNGYGSQAQSQQNLQAKPPLSPWSSTAYPEETLSNYLETFESNGLGLDVTSDDSREPSISIGHNECDEPDLSDFLTTWGDDTEQEEECFPSDAAPLAGNLATGPIDSESLQDDVHSDTSHAVSEAPNTLGRYSQAAKGSIEFSERTGLPRGLRRSISPRPSRNNSSFLPPSIVVSNNVSGEDANRKSYDLSGSCNSVDLLMGQIDIPRDAAQQSYEALAPLQRSIRPGVLNMHSANNYEMATQDRRPPHISGGIGSHSEQAAADSLNAFCVDADAAAAVADTCRTDPRLLHVRRPRLSRTRPAFQTSTDDLPLSQHPQKPRRKPPGSSLVQRSLQVPTYPTPPPSFKALPIHQYVDDAHTRDETLLAQATSSFNNPVEPRSPVSPPLSSLPAAIHGTTRCLECPKEFGGSPINQRNSLQRHVRDNHNGTARLACLVQECDVTFAPARKDNRLKHIRAVHPEYALLAPSKKRKRKADSDGNMC